MGALAPSRFWVVVFPTALVLLVLDISYLLLNGKRQVQTPAIEEVFKKATGKAAGELGTLSGVVPPTSYEVPVQAEHGPQFRTVEWIKGQGGLYWTLQVMQSGDEEAVKDYLAARPDKDQFAYFLQRVDGQMMYVAVYGNYVTRELALGVSEGLDFGLPNGQRAMPQKFQVYIDGAPLIQPAVDAPPAPTYGDVPPVPSSPGNVQDTPSVIPAPESPSNEPPVSGLPSDAVPASKP